MSSSDVGFWGTVSGWVAAAGGFLTAIGTWLRSVRRKGAHEAKGKHMDQEHQQKLSDHEARLRKLEDDRVELREIRTDLNWIKQKVGELCDKS